MRRLRGTPLSVQLWVGAHKYDSTPSKKLKGSTVYSVTGSDDVFVDKEMLPDAHVVVYEPRWRAILMRPAEGTNQLNATRDG